MQKRYAINSAGTALSFRSGLTLMELVVAMAAAVIVLFATAIVLVFGQRSYNHGWRQANLQRDAAYAMLKIKQSIRDATSAQLDEDGLGVKIYRPGGWIKFRFVNGSNNLQFQPEGEEEQTLLKGTVLDAAFEVDTVNHKTVTASLELADGDCQARISSTTLMRNFGT
jgi:hypothetical protein